MIQLLEALKTAITKIILDAGVDSQLFLLREAVEDGQIEWDFDCRQGEKFGDLSSTVILKLASKASKKSGLKVNAMQDCQLVVDLLN